MRTATAKPSANSCSTLSAGKGGIGGLLARSHAYQSGSGNFTNHNYYHADGNGNITYLVNSSQTVAASYRYDPYGNTISSSGTLASANVYRFSSKEIHVNSGLYYYGYRWYHPNLQRWLNRDPIEEEGGYNLFVFVGNAAANAFDDTGLRARYHAEPGNSPGNPVEPPFFPRPYPPPPADPNLVGGWDDGYMDCWLDCMLGLPTAAHVAAEAGGAKKAAGAYYHFTDGRFTDWGRSSKVLVPKLEGKIGALGWLVTACEAWICADKCWKLTNRADPDPQPELPYVPPYIGGQ